MTLLFFHFEDYYLIIGTLTHHLLFTKQCPKSFTNAYVFHSLKSPRGRCSRDPSFPDAETEAHKVK